MSADADEGLAWVRARGRASDLAGARSRALPGLHELRAALSIALAERRIDDAVLVAVELAEAGWWDPEVAATIVAHAGDEHPLAPQATSIVMVVLAMREHAREDASLDAVAPLLARLLSDGAVLEAFLAAEEAVRLKPCDPELDPRHPFVILVKAHLAFARGDAAAGEGELEAARGGGAPDDAAGVVEQAGRWMALLRAGVQSG